MYYLKWNNILASYFFNEQNEEKPVGCTRKRGQISEKPFLLSFSLIHVCTLIKIVKLSC